MPVVWLRLSEITDTGLDDGRPERCPFCHSQILQRWGSIKRSVIDLQDHDLEIYRYRCEECERTFRYYPQGTDSSVYTQRIRQLAGLAMILGMSSREVVDFFATLQVNISHSTVCRERQKLIDQIVTGQLLGFRKYSIDREYLHGISTKLGVALAVDLGPGRRAVLGTLDEFNPKAVKTWIESTLTDIRVDIAILGTSSLDPREAQKVIGKH